ncbi:unnamed protein product [Phytophthora lilii]|uniref:Unnamed protein product n=1 Tax=Phytophthora lilii TaxID=2077276 RepID=A0A9W6YK12_9STRA|nr:unnamed protein product [Phytophthora lilii]
MSPHNCTGNVAKKHRRNLLAKTFLRNAMMALVKTSAELGCTTASDVVKQAAARAAPHALGGCCRPRPNAVVAAEQVRLSLCLLSVACRAQLRQLRGRLPVPELRPELRQVAGPVLGVLAMGLRGLGPAGRAAVPPVECRVLHEGQAEASGGLVQDRTGRFRRGYAPRVAQQLLGSRENELLTLAWCEELGARGRLGGWITDVGGGQPGRRQEHGRAATSYAGSSCEVLKKLFVLFLQPPTQLALQMANMLANGPVMEDRGVLYVSGEESVLQVRMRAERLGSVSDSLFVASETNLDSVFRVLEQGNGRATGEDDYQGFGAIVVDSIQTVYAEDIPSPAGSVNQVKECTLRLLRLAKSRNVPVILISHVTKSGDIAGPKVLEHIVDTVVQLEGDPQSARRFLRCQKNRFGNTSEVGVFNMTDEGLQPLPNPLMAFVSSREDDDEDDYPEDSEDIEIEPLDGCSVTIAMEGKRPIPLEIQALANRTQYNVDAARGGGQAFSRVRGVGVAFDKLLLLFAVLEKRAKVSCRNQSVFVNIAEGYTIQEPAADLALAVALASSVLGRPVLERTAFLGEVSLSGHVRPVKMLESRLTAAQKIGLEVCVIPKEHDQATRRALRKKFANSLTVIEVSTLLQALKIAFRSPTTASFLSRSDGPSTAEEGSRL